MKVLPRIRAKLSDELREDGPVDGAVISFPKSGRTWLTFLYTYYGFYSLLGNAADAAVEEMAFTYRPERHLHKLLSKRPQPDVVPKLTFTHCLPRGVPYYSLEIPLEKVRTRAPRAIQLVRDPRDVVVSYYHHIRTRGIPTRDEKRLPEDVGLSEFLRSETNGIRPIVEHMNQGVRRGPEIFESFEQLFFEDLVADPARELTRLLRFFGAEQLDSGAVEKATERATFTRLQELETRSRSREDGEPERDALRFRRGRQGSHREELEDDDVAYLDAVLERHLDSRLARYRSSVRPGSPPGAAPG